MMKIIIVGSGPVGGFMAVLCSLMEFVVVVYEKRKDFTRNINLKIEENFFKKASDVLAQLNVSSDFFNSLNEYIKRHNNRILIKELETRFASKARELGAVFVTKEVKTFEQVFDEHRISNPIVLDCTGKNSKLRVDVFGSDEDNLVSIPLQNAMYLNFKAKMTNTVSLYQTLKHVKTVKLGELVIGKSKDDNGFLQVTLPAFITEEVAEAFDQEFPEINKSSINPFNTDSAVSNTIFFPIASLVGNLIADGCFVNLDSVAVNKINIHCGYSRKRSNDHFICLGDSAAFLAFFRSLNLGLRHALELFVKLSMKCNRFQDQRNVLEQFKHDNPTLNAIRVHPTEANNVFLVVTKVFSFGCFCYCATNRRTERLTSPMGVSEREIDIILQKLNRELSSWSYLLIDFEALRDREIANEIKRNKEKNVAYDQLSSIININSMSFLKLNELSRAVNGKYSLYTKDFEFLKNCFVERRNVINTSSNSEAATTIKIIQALIPHSESVQLAEMGKILCEENSSDDQRLNNFYEMIKSKSWRNSRKPKPSLLINAHVKGKFIADIIINEICTRHNDQDKETGTKFYTEILPESFLDTQEPDLMTF